MSNPKKEHYDKRTLSASPKKIDTLRGRYFDKLATGKYAVGQLGSFFDESSGGCLLFQKGRVYNKYEYDAAAYLAKDGYEVILTPESGEAYITASFTKGNKTINKYADGKIAGVLYEQRTPEPNPDKSLANNVRRAIEHAKKKQAKIALIYDANGLFHRNTISDGMAEYIKYSGKSEYNTIERVCVISKEGKVHWWHWE